MDLFNFITENFGPYFTVKENGEGELFGTALDGDFCLNWLYNSFTHKIEMYLFSPLGYVPGYKYKQEQSLLVKRFKKSELVEKVRKIGTKQINIYLKYEIRLII